MRQLREAQMSAPVESWLRSMGYEVWVEIPMFYRVIDIVARKGDSIIAIELKVQASREVAYQAANCQLFTTEVYAAVACLPRQKTLEQRFERLGLGVLYVDGESVTKLLAPKVVRPHMTPHLPYVKEINARLDAYEPGGTAGRPTMKGEGPAIEVYAAIQKLRTEEPKITWKEIYRRIPNHYASYRSLQSSMLKVEIRDAIKKRREAAKASAQP